MLIGEIVCRSCSDASKTYTTSGHSGACSDLEFKEDLQASNGNDSGTLAWHEILGVVLSIPTVTGGIFSLYKFLKKRREQHTGTGQTIKHSDAMQDGRLSVSYDSISTRNIAQTMFLDFPEPIASDGLESTSTATCQQTSRDVTPITAPSHSTNHEYLAVLPTVVHDDGDHDSDSDIEI